MPEYESSVIAGATYDAAKQELTVEFRSGAVYVYKGVPPEEAEAFASAESKGGFFAAYIRNSYTSARQEPQEPDYLTEETAREAVKMLHRALPKPRFAELLADVRALLAGLELTNEEGIALINEVRLRMRRP
jgi:hypothetical protein